MRYALGKRPARNAVAFAFSRYTDLERLPKPPKVFGMQRLVKEWGMLANDRYGNCVFAGAAHETMVYCREGGGAVEFTDEAVLSDYSAVTGFRPEDPNTDEGTDLASAAKYRRNVGILDAAGRRHKVDAYVSIKPASLDELMVATYLFGAVGIGLMLPTHADDQFDNMEPWEIRPGRREVEGGHYVTVVGRNSKGHVLVVTWGRLHAMTPEFFQAYNDEGIAYLSPERFRDRVSPEGFHYDALKGDLASLRHR